MDSLLVVLLVVACAAFLSSVVVGLVTTAFSATPVSLDPLLRNWARLSVVGAPALLHSLFLLLVLLATGLPLEGMRVAESLLLLLLLPVVGLQAGDALARALERLLPWAQRVAQRFDGKESL